MIQTQTYLDIADNSGARRVMCIKVLGGSTARGKYTRRTAGVGDEKPTENQNDGGRAGEPPGRGDERSERERPLPLDEGLFDEVKRQGRDDHREGEVNTE